MSTESPYERMQREAEAKRKDLESARVAAGRERYHIIKVSPYRYRVIVETSFSEETNNVKNVITFGFVTEPTTFDDAYSRLKALRGH